MTFLEKIAYIDDIVFVTMLIIIALLDTILILLVKSRKPLLENNYINLHRKYGYLTVTIVKLIGVIAIVYATLTHQPSEGALAAPIIAYGVFVGKALFDFLRQSGRESGKNR